MKIKSSKEHFMNCRVAAFTYYQGCEVFEKLKIGAEVQLVREDENAYDRKAIAIFFGEAHIGYIPRQQNELLARFFDLGYGDLFEARIQSINATAHPEEQVSITVFIKRKDA